MADILGFKPELSLFISSDFIIDETMPNIK